MAKKRTYGFGIVGCGMISDFHAEAIEHLEGAELVACHDTVKANAERLAEARGCEPYTDIDEFLKHPGLDIVTICTPSGAHMEPAVKAARAKKHLLVEKPLEITLSRCDRIIREAEKAGVMLAGIFPSRFNEAIQVVKKAVEKEHFGPIAFANATIKWYRSQEYYDSGGWRGTWELDGGGAIMNQGIHTVDLLQWLMGPVEEIQAMTACRTHERIEVEDTAIAVLRFQNGALGLIEGSTSAYPGFPREIEIYGKKGSVIYTDFSITLWEVQKETAFDRKVKGTYVKKAEGAAGAADPRAISYEPHLAQFRDFLHALKRRRKVAVDGREARKAVELVIGLYVSARRGKPVRFPVRFSRSPKDIRPVAQGT